MNYNKAQIYFNNKEEAERLSEAFNNSGYKYLSEFLKDMCLKGIEASKESVSDMILMKVSLEFLEEDVKELKDGIGEIKTLLHDLHNKYCGKGGGS